MRLALAGIAAPGSWASPSDPVSYYSPTFQYFLGVGEPKAVSSQPVPTDYVRLLAPRLARSLTFSGAFLPRTMAMRPVRITSTMP